MLLRFQKTGVKSQTLKSEGKITIAVESRDTNAIVPFLKKRPQVPYCKIIGTQM
jgi:hydrogenase maturation factor